METLTIFTGAGSRKGQVSMLAPGAIGYKGALRLMKNKKVMNKLPST